VDQESILEKYKLEIIPIRIAGKNLELYGIRNWDIFVNNLAEKGDDYVKLFPFWVKIWEASILLADHLMRIGLEREKEILEIGAGMGVTGLFLGAFGHKVTITDREEDALELLRMNVERNRLHNVSVRKLDWSNPDLSGKFDIICGAEVIYNDTSIQSVMNLCHKYLQPGGSIYLAHDVKRMCIIKFIGMVPGKFEIKNIIRTLKAEGRQNKVVIHSLRLI
jgi:2-polyprenyl-3-methyl-5-hydroxy-6-metoxy-1,4-benzoquinol methylase